ncbi:MAG: flagellar assembly peptidoglycan hydrolase FlgJ [Pseudomonadota bacterium]
MKPDSLNTQNFVLDVNAAAKLRAQSKQDPQAGLHQAAQQFESLMLQMMLKSMRDASSQEGMFDSDQTRFFTSVLDQQWAQNLSAQGKLGFAKLIEKQLGRQLPVGAANLPTSVQNNAALNSSNQNLVNPAAVLESLQRSLLSEQMSGTAAGMAPTSSVRPAGVDNGSPQRGADAAQAASTAGVAGGTPADRFVGRIWPYAQAAANTLGVPAHFVAAHAALESGWGKSEIRRADGAPSYNLFGVKAGANWQGATAEVATTEYVQGVAQSSREKFRVYGSYAEAFGDYARLLQNNTRFAPVLGQQDAQQFAQSLQQSGYATDPHYADKLARIINGSTLRSSRLA